MNFLKLERRLQFKDEKYKRVSRWNTENGTLYHFYLDLIRKEYIGGVSSAELGKYFGHTGLTIREQLRKMGVELRPPGGANNTKLTHDIVKAIRNSHETGRVLAERHGYNQGGISLIRRGLLWPSPEC